MKTKTINKNTLRKILSSDEMDYYIYRLDTFTGPVFAESVDVAIGLYNDSPDVYSLQTEDSSTVRLICYKPVPFPVDVYHLWYGREFLSSIQSKFEHGEENVTLSEEVTIVSKYVSYYAFHRELIDMPRRTIFRLTQSIQGSAGLFGNLDGIMESAEQIQTQIGALIDPYIIPGPIEDDCILKPEWRILSNSINS